MLTFAAVLCLILLFWIATMISRIAPALDELRRKCGNDPLLPDIEYPAFPRDQVRHAYHQLEKTQNESIEAEKKLFTSPGWKEITSGLRGPDVLEKGLMYDCAFSTLMWEVMLSRCQFLIEANLRVQRGEWTIAQAHYFYRTPEPMGFELAGDARQRVDEWCSSLQDKDLSESRQSEFNERMRPFEREREEILGKWKERFKAMHGSKPIYQYHNGGQD